MTQYVDLHTHSIYSEGVLSCAALLKLANQNQVRVLSLTDHNVIDGLPEIIRLSKKYRIKIIPGVELYTHYQGKGFHLLGYNFKLGDTPLNKVLRKLQSEHQNQVKHSIAKLKLSGFVINEKRLFQNPSRYLGAVHLWQEIEEHSQNRKKISREIPPQYNYYLGKINYYLGKDKPGHFALSELPLLKAVEIIKKEKGVAVLAHPGQQLTFKDDQLLLKLIKKGLDGLEVFSPHHNWHQIEHYLKIAVKNKLAISGGSDFHGYANIKGQGIITKQWDYYKIPFKLYQNFKMFI